MKFFTFDQNNANGYFKCEGNLAPYLIIEAENAVTANDRAENFGVYFDRQDCKCCGNRWSRSSEQQGAEQPSIWGKDLLSYYKTEIPYILDTAIVVYADGRRELWARGADDQVLKFTAEANEQDVSLWGRLEDLVGQG